MLDISLFSVWNLGGQQPGLIVSTDISQQKSFFSILVLKLWTNDTFILPDNKESNCYILQMYAVGVNFSNNK